MGIIILYSFAVILLSLFLYFSSRFFSSILKFNHSNESGNTPLEISLVVAVKNEAGNVPGLINSLSLLNYPENLLEIILIDDNSSDGSYELMSKITTGNRLFKIHKAENKPYPGKKGVLTLGIKKTSHKYIMITDADCSPEKNWLLKASARFSEGYDLVFGIAPFHEENSAVNKISCFENLRSSILSFGLAGMGIYYSAAARNFGFRKDSFEKIKGYSNTTETLSGDDDLLIREAVKNNLKIGLMADEGSKVYSRTKDTFKEYFTQRSRHTKTSFYYLPGVQILLGLWHITNLILLFSIIVSPFNPVFIFPFMIKIISDIFIVIRLQRIFGYRFKISEVLVLQITYEIFLIINFINAALRKDRWR